MWMDIRIKLISGGKMPEYKTAGSACADCCARLPTENITLLAKKQTTIPLGFAIEIPEGFEAVIRPRSGLASKDMVYTIEGTIDSDYRGEVKAIVFNNSDEDFVIHNLDRICQMKIQEARQVRFMPVDELSETERGSGGFGHTGLK